jgi:hypothetical protein
MGVRLSSDLSTTPGPSMLLPTPLLQGAEVVSALHLEAAESGSPEILDG